MTRHRHGIRVAGVTSIALLWVAMLFLALEVAERIRFRRLGHDNIFATEEGLRRAELAEASDSTVWASPYSRYKRNFEVVREIRGIRYQIRTSSRGYRTDEVAIPKPPGTFRIVCVGGSTTVEGVTNATTYPALLQQDLRRRLADSTFEVVNCGVSGVLAEFECASLGRYLAFEPDLLLEYNAVNDIRRMMFGFLRPKHRLDALVRHSLFLCRVFKSRWQPSHAALERAVDGVMKDLETLHDQAAKQGVPVIFATFVRPDPRVLSRQERDFFDYNWKTDWNGGFTDIQMYCQIVDLYNSGLAELCRRKGTLLLPLAAEFPGEKRYFSDLCHLTPEGISRKAEILGLHLAAHLESRPISESAPGR